jgi:hypothetical protein
MTLTKQDILDMLETPVGEIDSTRVICKQCGYFDGPYHQMIYCAKCGGQFISVSDWTIKNLLKRVDEHCNSENWLCGYVARWLNFKKQIDFSIALTFAAQNAQFIKDVFRESNGDKGATKRLLNMYPSFSVSKNIDK